MTTSPPATATDLVDAARRLAADLLWPRSLEIDALAAVPVDVLDALAAAGLYGAALEPDAMPDVVEALGGASLATAFVWIQHHTPVRTVAAARPEVRDRWLGDLRAARVRAGVAIAALRRPGPPAMVATDGADGGLVLDGHAPWVTGWGLIDVVLVAARHGDDLVLCLVDAAEGPHLQARRSQLAAVDASSTYELAVDGLVVPAGRIASREPFADWQARDAAGLAGNGHLAIGIAARCAGLLDPGPLTADVDAARRQLRAARAPHEVVDARAEASLLAVRAATALVAWGGGRSVERGEQAQRLLREAMFLVVFGQTRAIRAAQLERLGA